MRKLLCGGIRCIAVVMAMLIGTLVPAGASPITYTLSNASATIRGSGTDDIFGNFTFDPSLSNGLFLISADIRMDGPVFPGGGYGSIIDLTASGFEIEGSAAFIIFQFASDLSRSPDPISSVEFLWDGGLYGLVSISATGEAVPAPTPLPPTATLFATVLGLVGFFIWRRSVPTAA